MKTTILWARATSLIAALCLPVPLLYAEDTNSTPTTQAAPTASQPAAATAPAKLPYGVEDVLKLSRAQVGDEITLNYIRNSGTIYALTPQDIVYLRSQGVSERVVNAMIDQRKVVTQATPAAQQVSEAPTVANAPTFPDASTAAAPPEAQVAPVYTQPQTTPASSVYVIPGPTYSSPYYYGYPYYGYPYYYGGPVVSFGFGYGYPYYRSCYPYYGHGYYGHGYYGHYTGGHYGGGHYGGGGHAGHH